MNKAKPRKNGHDYYSPVIDEEGNDITFEEEDMTQPEPEFEETPTRPLPEIYTHGKQLRMVTQEVIAALEQANTPQPTLFVRTSELVTIAEDENGSPNIKTLTLDALRGVMARTANFYDKPGEKRRAVHPHMDFVRDLYSLQAWPFPPIKAIVETPIIRPDGTVLDTPGYDTATQLYYRPSKALFLALLIQPPLQKRELRPQAAYCCSEPPFRHSIQARRRKSIPVVHAHA